MSVPDYQSLMRPVLDVASDTPLHISDAATQIADILDLSEEDLEDLIPSGTQTTFINRVHWAKTYLKQAGLLSYPRRAHFVLTDKGRESLASHKGPVGNADLKVFKSFRDFQSRKKPSDENSEFDADVKTFEDLGSDNIQMGSDNIQTPDEQIAFLHKTLNEDLAAELIERVRDMPPVFFEQLLVKLLIKMGYGGSAQDAGRGLGKSGDGGVDGVIDQDRLGVDQVYIQAKRYAEGNTVGAGDIRDFFGALNMKRATKGIFFTTSTFTKGARETASALGTRIVLIDGRQLARLMIETNVGCREETTLVIRRIDEDFFDQV